MPILSLEGWTSGSAPRHGEGGCKPHARAGDGVRNDIKLPSPSADHRSGLIIDAPGIEARRY